MLYTCRTMKMVDEEGEYHEQSTLVYCDSSKKMPPLGIADMP